MKSGASAFWDETAHLKRVFGLLVLFRWLSLLPPLILLLSTADAAFGVPALAAAALSNLLITAVPARLNQLLRRAPYLLGVDLAFAAALMALTGGWRSLYYLFALSPLLASAFFFQLRGALVAAGVLAPLYVAGGAASARLGGPPLDPLVVSLAVVSFFLVAGIFGYAASLLDRVREAHDDLSRSHRELRIIYDLTVSLQNAPVVSEVQERVLEAVTRDLGFRRAVVGLMEQPRMILAHWAESENGSNALATSSALTSVRFPVEPGGGLLSAALLGNQMRTLAPGDRLAKSGDLDAALALHGEVLIAPMTLRDHPIGVLLVETEGAAATPANLASLRAIASQAAVALGTTMLCIDRAQRLAVQEERIRFAREIHDTVSQSLFGIAFALDGLGKLLPEKPDVVKSELEQIRQVADRTRAEVRQSILDIWPSALTAESFRTDLLRFVGQFGRQDQLALDVTVSGDFSALSPRRQRSLYRVAQEALTNVVKHSGARRAGVCLTVLDGQARLEVRDDGRGFDPPAALARERDREHFGLKGIQERIATLGGRAEFASAPGRGATVSVSIPVVARGVESDDND